MTALSFNTPAFLEPPDCRCMPVLTPKVLTVGTVAAPIGSDVSSWSVRAMPAAKKAFYEAKLRDVTVADREFTGYGSVSGVLDQTGDIVMPGAFRQTIASHKAAGSMPMLFWMHDPSRVPGKWLDMAEDDHGLKVHGWLAPTPLGDEARVLLKSGSVDGLSIGYMPVDTDVDRRGNRLLKSVALWEVSLVSLPANTAARVDTASVKIDSDTLNQIEELLRRRMSKSEARERVYLLKRGELPNTDWRDNFADSNLLDAIRAARETVRGLRWTR